MIGPTLNCMGYLGKYSVVPMPILLISLTSFFFSNWCSWCGEFSRRYIREKAAQVIKMFGTLGMYLLRLCGCLKLR